MLIRLVGSGDARRHSQVDVGRVRAHSRRVAERPGGAKYERMAHTIPAAMAWTLSLLNDFFLSGLKRIIRLTLAIGIVRPGVSLV